VGKYSLRLAIYGALTLAAVLPVARPYVGVSLAQTRDEAVQVDTEPLQLVTASGPHKFAVEVMKTDEQRARGLMFRRFLPADRGMLFDFKTEQPVMMWMKNTYLPLDMVFIARTGVVVSVAQNTEPLSERTIASGPPAFAVLEVNAGTAAKIGLKAGDRVEHPMFRR
jgi:uncharacterized membrane protein (UPF0127 family)